MLNIFTGSFELGAIILFFLALIGFGVHIFGCIKGEEGQMLQNIGKYAGHGFTAIMMIVMMAKLSYPKSF